MDQPQGLHTLFDLFESSGIGLLAIDGEDRVIDANRNVGTYLGIDAAALAGRPLRDLESKIRSAEFWEAYPGTFYCLAPGPDNLLLVVSRLLGDGGGERGLRRAVILRPYSLEREFGRMRVSLSNYLAHEIAAHLGSIGIASEFITEPELQGGTGTRDAFLSSFRLDISDLNTLFVQLLETAEPLALPHRLSRGTLDWRALVEDLAGKIRGLASERSVGLSCLLPPHLPGPKGDYHWLYLALHSTLSHALRGAAPVTEVEVTVRPERERIETRIVSIPPEDPPETPWPPPALFALAEDNPRIGRLEISELAVTRAIFQLHGGDLRLESAPGRTTHLITLPL